MNATQVIGRRELSGHKHEGLQRIGQGKRVCRERQIELDPYVHGWRWCIHTVLLYVRSWTQHQCSRHCMQSKLSRSGKTSIYPADGLLFMDTIVNPLALRSFITPLARPGYAYSVLNRHLQAKLVQFTQRYTIYLVAIQTIAACEGRPGIGCQPYSSDEWASIGAIG